MFFTIYSVFIRTPLDNFNDGLKRNSHRCWICWLCILLGGILVAALVVGLRDDDNDEAPLDRGGIDFPDDDELPSATQATSVPTLP